MSRRDFIWGIAAVIVASCARQPAQEASDASIPDPAEVIRPLYEHYIVPSGELPSLLDQAPWSAAMRGQLEAMMARSQSAQEPILDFDPIVNAQDHEIGTVAVTTDAVVENSHAVVRARFVNMGSEDEVVFDLVWEDAGWKVDNIRHEAWDLRQILAGGPG